MLFDGDEVSWLMVMIVVCVEKYWVCREFGCGMDWVGVVGKM